MPNNYYSFDVDITEILLWVVLQIIPYSVVTQVGMLECFYSLYSYMHHGMYVIAPTLPLAGESHIHHHLEGNWLRQ